MTRDEATAEAQRKQRAQPGATWIATQRDGEWVVASIGVAPSDNQPIATAIKPVPAPQDAAHSPLERVVTQFGAGG